MFYSGIDWSGDPGDPRKSTLPPLLVIAIAHVAGDNLAQVSAMLNSVREQRGLPSAFSFRFAGCAEGVREAFFQATASLPIQARVLVVDKRQWDDRDLSLRGQQRLHRAIADLVCRCPPDRIAGQVLLVDLPKQENAAVIALKRVINTGLRTAGIHPAATIKACPDHRLQGIIVQVADMIAGAVQRDGGQIGASLGPLRRVVTLV